MQLVNNTRDEEWKWRKFLGREGGKGGTEEEKELFVLSLSVRFFSTFSQAADWMLCVACRFSIWRNSGRVAEVTLCVRSWLRLSSSCKRWGKKEKKNAFVEDFMQYDTDTQGDTNNTLLLVMSFASKIPFCINSSACITLNWHTRTNQIY